MISLLIYFQFNLALCSIQSVKNENVFSENCTCTFKELGRKTKHNVLHIYISGINFNPKLESCSMAWGEYIYNVVPSDTLNELKIHLLAVSKFELPKTKSDYGSKKMEKYVISVFTYNIKTGTSQCEFDPFKTGKYPKPKYWKD